MNREIVHLFECSYCSKKYQLQEFEIDENDKLKEGVFSCNSCNLWYPISNGIADFLPYGLSNNEKKEFFSKKWNIDPEPFASHEDSEVIADKKKQIEFFNEDTHIYDDNMECTPFWKANDWNCLKDWLYELVPEHTLLDVGCGTGRASTPFAKNGVKVIGLDISEEMVIRAKRKSESLGLIDNTDYVVGDSENLPFATNSFDAVLAFGVLHHVPSPQRMLQQMSRVLKNNGFYFGHENNKTVFRPLFDLLMKFSRLWIEEAGNHPLISISELKKWSVNADINMSIKSSVFLPPHLLNFLNFSTAKKVIYFSDKFLNLIPFIRNNGGVLVIKGRKTNSD
ncbi:MAG: class I SAM-dependent methyltransferase [Bacteroidota bacterium]|nr:class I SAM-dependent methyltransferase [Bacteroidota bacterium]